MEEMRFRLPRLPSRGQNFRIEVTCLSFGNEGGFNENGV